MGRKVSRTSRRPAKGEAGLAHQIDIDAQIGRLFRCRGTGHVIAAGAAQGGQNFRSHPFAERLGIGLVRPHDQRIQAAFVDQVGGAMASLNLI